MLEWDFINKTLNFFNFGDEFKRWIKILYGDISSCVVNNGWTTETVKPTRGVRQGCPLSPYLFIICAEIFAIDIRANVNVKGIKIGEDEHKIIQFADDTVLVLKYEQQTLQTACELLRKFSIVSGLRINLEKTIIMRIGSIKHSTDILLPNNKIQWTNTCINLLGTVIPNDRSKLTDLNYTPKIKKIEQIIQLWRQRDLTLYGKVQLIKTYLISQIIYLLSVLPAPTLEFIKQLERILFQFLWNTKTERIKRTTLYRTLAEGGISMPHLPTFNYALKLAWLRRLHDPNNKGSWKNLLLNKLPMGSETWACNLKFNDVASLSKYITNKFWREVLEAWSIYNYDDTVDNTDVTLQTIWFNSSIKVGHNTIFYKEWYRKGIKIIDDLLDENKQFLTFQQFVNKYNVNTDFVTYYGIIQAIPGQWKRVINLGNIPSLAGRETKMCKLMKYRKVCKETYSIFLEFLVDTKWAKIPIKFAIGRNGKMCECKNLS
jgi:hypothetical protein